MQESGEMYLETILVLSREKDAVRAIDVGQKMGYSKPSVSRAMAKLRGDGYLLVDGNGYLRLTFGDPNRKSALHLIDIQAREEFIPELRAQIHERIDIRIEIV